MRIFYAAESTFRPEMPGVSIWYWNLYLPLQDLGHDVVAFDYDLWPHYLHADINEPVHQAFIAGHRHQLEEALLLQVVEAHSAKPIDVFFSYFYSALVTPETIRRIGEMGITTVNWYCNASYQFDLVSDIAPAFDWCLVPEEFRLEDYRRVGANPIYCQEAANPNIYRPYPLPHDTDVVFIGGRYGDRERYIRALLEDQVDVRAFGAGWTDLIDEGTTPDAMRRVWGRAKRKVLGIPEPVYWTHRACNPPISDQGMLEMYSKARISLGFSSVGETHRETRIKQVRLRDFEAPMSGAFYMVEYMEELEQFFVPDKEVVCYTDADDLVDKVDYYLRHPKEREAIRVAGHERALRDHTWQKRLADAFAEMGLTDES